MQNAQKKNDPNYKGKTVLLVEDDAVHRQFMEKILGNLGFEIVLAENGMIALAKLQSGLLTDLIIMDRFMPELDGLETVRRIRARQVRENIPHVPVIAFTASQDEGDREKCLAAGMDAYMPKQAWMPKWRENLLQTLADLLP